MRHAHGRAGWDLPISIRQGPVRCDARDARCHAVGKTEAFLYESGEIINFLKLFQIWAIVVIRLDIGQLCSEFLEYGGALAQVVRDDAEYMSDRFRTGTDKAFKLVTKSAVGPFFGREYIGSDEVAEDYSLDFFIQRVVLDILPHFLNQKTTFL